MTLGRRSGALSLLVGVMLSGVMLSGAMGVRSA